MDGFTTLVAFIIFIGLLMYMIRVVTIGDPPVSPSDEGATELKADVPSPPIGAASSSALFQFDAFLSFRGQDIRNKFVCHLYKDLKRSNVNAFMDNSDLGKGEPIENLLNYIRKSRILLPIFSKNYADSIWCLKEVTEMVKVMKTDQRVHIVPIFFDAEPDDVRSWYRHSEGQFRTGKNAGEKKKWMKALRKVASIHGLSLKNIANGNEAEFVDKIVEEVQAKLGKTALHVAKYLIGMEGHVQEVKKLLKKDGQAANMIALHGMSGIGKTTIAKAVYNELFHDFHGASTFISDVGEKFRKGEGVKCQEQLIYDIMGKEDRFKHSIGTTDAGINKIKETTMSRKVLVVLDDIDRAEQLRALAGARAWFGSGSVIIITTKDNSLLSNHGIVESQIYEPKPLDEEESFQLLVRHALKSRQPTKRESDVLREIAKTARGLPLAIEVLGPHLSCKRSMDVWRRELEKLNDIPVEDVESKLKISYDGLPDVEKAIFLDICCFFVGADCGRLTHYYWEACRFHSESAIKLLQDRSLISLDKQNRFQMHDLVRNMGREIVLRRSEVPPNWKLSRVWTSDDIFDLLERDEVPGSSKVTGIVLNKGVEEGKELHKRVECFRNMHCLRLLHMEGINFKNNFHYFPKELLWLGLPRCSFESPPSGLNLRKLVILNLSNCNLASLSFFGDKVFEKLKVLDLSSTDLTRTPNFCNFRSLVELTLRRCEKLTNVHRSIGELENLVTLDMRTCTLLEELPDTICDLRSLEVLHLGWCLKLSSLPEQIGDLRTLKELSLNDTAIRKVPASVGQLTCLSELPLQRCKWLEPLPDSLTDWFSSGRVKMYGTPLGIIEELDLSKGVQKLRVSSCKCLAVLPDESSKLVKEFYLTNPTVQEVPHSIRRLQNLDILSLKCEQLRSLAVWINGRQLETLKRLEIESKSLKNLPESIGSLEGLKRLKLVCENLQSLPDSIGSLRSLRKLKVECSRIKVIPESIKQLEELEKLKLQVDNPRALSDSTRLPKKLKKFSLSCNDLENLPDCVWSLVELEEFSLRGCGRIEALPDDKLGKLKNLLHLDLSRTGVKTIPKNICCLPKLRSLQITDVGNDTTFWFE